MNILLHIDNQKLEAAIAKAVQKLDEAAAILKPLTVTLTNKERAGTPRPPASLGPMARQLASAVTRHPDVAAAACFNIDEILGTLENVEVLGGLTTRLEQLKQMVADTRLDWLARVWRPSLAAYAIAKVAARTNGEMKTIVDSVAPTFALRRQRPPKPVGSHRN